MQKITAFLHLIRLQNLLIVALTQYFIRFAFTKTFLPFPALNDLEFFLFVFTMRARCINYFRKNVIGAEYSGPKEAVSRKGVWEGLLSPQCRRVRSGLPTGPAK